MRQPPGTLAIDSMPPPLVGLFRRTFLTTDRPQAREWIELLDELAKALKKCELHSGHYYYREAPDCPWCGIESQARVRLFNFLVTEDGSRRGHFRLDEIWKDIVSVEAPGASLIRWDKILEAPLLSAEVAAFAKVSNERFILALILSALFGQAISMFIPSPFSLIVLFFAGFGAYALARGTPYFVENIQARQLRAKEDARRLQKQYDHEAGDKRWRAKLGELRNRKETYENLEQIRQLRIQQLESETRKYQLDEFLDQFKINDYEISGFIPSAKNDLLSHGIETAADVREISELMRIPSIGSWAAKSLLEWRRGLEQRFVFNPARGVSSEARVRVEREVDALRFHLESELRGGAHHLLHMKKEIETNKQKLQPMLAQARRKVSQAEKDLEVASKRRSAALVLIPLILAYIIGMAMMS
jgi:DNA-binding helix-hairpin-helix protein with protein kinase domain